MHRRDFLHTAAAASSAALWSASRDARAAEPAAKDTAFAKPNVVVILVDDLGVGDLTCHGAKDLRTPHLDRLMAQGMRLNNFYANCPVCSPTRASVLTGRYMEMVGVPGVIRTYPHSSWGHLTPEAVLLPKVLKPAGYHSAIVGKWHLGLAEPNRPTDRGFDFFHGWLGDMMDDYYKHRRHGQNYMRKNTETLDTQGTHATELFTAWARDYLKSRAGKKQPFFLYLAYNAPHGPIQPPKDWLAKVRQREKGIAEKRARLVALIEHMDDGVGRVLKTLDETGLAKNTLLIFTSDNGGALHYAANNGPWRDGKGSCYEGGIREPACARWPGHIQPGTRTDRIALTMDIFPTVAEAAGAEITHEIDGVSFLPTLLGRKQPPSKRDLFFGRLEGGRGGAWETHAIRRGDWKLIWPRHDKPMELYNLAKDPKEARDLAKAEPAKFAELKAALEAQLARYAKVPWRPPGQKAALPRLRT